MMRSDRNIPMRGKPRTLDKTMVDMRGDRMWGGMGGGGNNF